MANELEISSSLTDGHQRRGGKSRSIFNRLRLRSRSVANISREKPSGNYFSSWFSKKPTPSNAAASASTAISAAGVAAGNVATSATDDEADSLQTKTLKKYADLQTSPIYKKHCFKSNGLTSTEIGDCDRRQMSASHSNLQSTTTFHPEMNGRLDDAHSLASNAGTSKMPSYVNISLAANGYSRSRTNLHTVLSRSGDVHRLIVDGTDVRDVNPDHKAVIFVGDAMKKSPSNNSSPFSFIIPEFAVNNESLSIFRILADNLQNSLSKSVENSEAILSRTDISEEAREAILVASGHTRVLLKSKIKKMLQLIEKHKETNAETVTLNDLASFWEMMDIDVSKIREQFAIVEKFRLNEWKPLPDDAISSQASTPRSTPKQKPAKLNSKIDTPRTASSTPRASARPNVKEFLAARRKEMANNQKVENGHNGDTLVATQ
jgi:hypothetical protein